MTSDPEAGKAAIARTLDLMWARFLPDIRERIDVLDDAAAAAASGALTDDLRKAAHAAAHKLAGSLGTFGLQRATDLARDLEARYARPDTAASEPHVLADQAREIRRMAEGRDAARPG